MQTNRGATKATLLIVIALVISLGAITAYVVLSSGKNTSTSQPPAPSMQGDELEALTLPVSWAEHDPQESVEVILKPGGPLLKIGQLQWSPTPVLRGLGELRWERTRQDSRTLITGHGTWHGSPVTLRWSIEDGDPQIALLIEMENLPAARLGEPIEATISLPKGATYEVMHSSMVRQPLESTTVLDAWSPQWLRAKHESQTLSFSGWDVDRATVDPHDSSITFSLWHPAHHPPLASCDASLKLTLRRRLELTLGERLELVASRLPEGYQAAVAPTFTLPASHPDAALHEGSPRSAADWVRRATTLLYGHSLESDPRFGNGGLLGIGLGGGIFLPAKWKNAPEIAAFKKRLKSARAAILIEPSPAGAPGQAGELFAQDFDCDAFLSTPSDEVMLSVGPVSNLAAHLNVLEPGEALVINEQAIMTTLPGFFQAHATYLELAQLDGQRQTLTQAVFGREALQGLLDARGIAWFAAPLVATRNPLEAAATQSILDPERQGHWTLTPSLTRALGNVELLNEEARLLVTHPRELLSHWRQTRRVQLRELADGSYAILNPGEVIPGFTLIAPGDLEPTLGKDALAPAGREVITSPSGETQTWFWWELEQGVTHVHFGASDVTGSPLRPVLWSVRD